jgi:hypothetical protein
MSDNHILFYVVISVFILGMYLSYGIRAFQDKQLKNKYYTLILCYPFVLLYLRQTEEETTIDLTTDITIYEL